MTTSASPFRRSASGSVVSSDGSHTTRTGQWKAPTTFFAPGRSIAVLPPIPASTWPTSVVGTADHATPRMYVAAAKPATSVVEPPPSATTLPSRPIANRPQRRSSTAGVLAGSPAGTSWRATSRAPSPTWARIPWMPGDVRVGDELDGTVAGHEVAELVDRPRARRGRPRPRAGRRRRRAPSRPRPPRRAAAAPGAASGSSSSARASGRSVPATRCQAVSGSTSRRTVKARAARSDRVRSESTAPPPSATTSGSPPASTSRATSSSSARKPASPRDANSSCTEAPARFSISSSRSTNGRPVRAAAAAPGARLPGAHEAGEREVPAQRVRCAHVSPSG